MIARPTVSLALLALLLAPAVADEPKAFSLQLRRRASRYAYDKGAFTAEKASPLAFGIAAIDLKAQTAELKMEGGTGAAARRAGGERHAFPGGGDRGLPARHDDLRQGRGEGRHLSGRALAPLRLVGQPLVTQYQGFCEATG